jgi:hypothetical protein
MQYICIGLMVILLLSLLVVAGIDNSKRLRGDYLTKEDRLLIDKVIDLLKTPKSQWSQKDGFFMHPSDEMGFKYWYEDDPYVKAGDSYAYVREIYN